MTGPPPDRRHRPRSTTQGRTPQPSLPGAAGRSRHRRHEQHGRPDRELAKRRALGISIAAASTLTIVKLVVAAITGSVAVLSEAAHSLTDLAAAAIALFAVRRAAHPPDRRHRYGHGKVENLSAIVEGVIILVAITYVGWRALAQLFGDGAEVHVPWLAAIVMAASSAVNLVVARHLAAVARETESAAVHADAQHIMTDVYTSAGTAVGLGLVATTGVDAIDPVVALMVAALVARIGFRLVTGSLGVLLDEGLPHGEIRMIERVIDDACAHGVTGFHRLRTRRSGSRRHVDLHLTIDGTLSLNQAHDLAHRVEHAVEDALPGVDVLIHIEPDTVAPPPGLDLGPGDRP